MGDNYSWGETRSSGAYRLPGPEHLGWWAAVAMLVSILLHVVVFFMLDNLKIAFHFEKAKELSTQPINTQQVEIRPMADDIAPPPEDIVVPPNDAASLMEEIDLLAVLPKDQEIDIRPDALNAEYALQMQKPAMEGDPQAIAFEAAAGMEVDGDLPEFGSEPATIRPAEVGQITVDPGSAQVDDDLNLGKFTDDLIKRGAGGQVEKGVLDGITSLDQLLDLPPNILLGKKTMLPSDLLFEFNSSELRESAKVGMMKLGLLMDKNPNLYCWIEGHTDLVGGDEFNLELSIQRAQSVKDYLVESMRMDSSRIITRGFGRYEPLVIQGDSAAQAANRRVEIRMRKSPPDNEQLKITPKKAAVVVEEVSVRKAPVVIEEPPMAEPPAPPPPPKAVLVKPKRALPVQEEPAPPRAAPVEEEPQMIEPLPEIPKAAPVETEPEPVDPNPGVLRATPVEE